MATIQDTLNEITQIQTEFEAFGNDNSLVKELTNISTVIYFDYLSHSILDQSRTLDLSAIEGSVKYYELFSQEGLLSEYIRINNIGQFSIVWNAYEKYLRGKYLNDYGLTKFNIKDLFKDLIDKTRPSSEVKIIEEFEVMRNTRNSLHNGGIYNDNFPSFSGVLCGLEYTFSPGDSLKPLRIIDVIKTMWFHYKKLEKINE